MLEGRSFEREPIYYLNIEMNTHTCTHTHYYSQIQEPQQELNMQSRVFLIQKGSLPKFLGTKITFSIRELRV